MFILLAMLLAAPSTPFGISNPAAPRPNQAATVRVTLNGGDYAPGDRVRVQVEPSQDGYLVVFRVDGDGHIRVLFPLDPDLDAFVKGGKRYELRGRGQRETFLADDRGGTGLIYAALTRQPLAFGEYSINDHWDYNALRLRDQDSDAEADLAAVVGRMTNNGRFDYDVIGYRVHENARIVASSGGSFDPYYDPYWSCLSCGWGYGRGSSIGISIGSRNNNWYGYNDPWYYDPYAYNAYYGYYGYPYGGTGYLYPGQYRPITVVHLPRPQVPNTAYGFRARARQPNSVAGSFTPDLTRAMRPEVRPTTGNRGGTISRGGNDNPGRQRNDDGARTRRRPESGSQPIFREPRREQPTEPSRPERRSQERPVYREPPRAERPVERSAPPPQSAPPRVERPSSPPPSAPSGGSDRARRRP